ncbi:PH domain-containing protein [Aeromonas veronii]
MVVLPAILVLKQSSEILQPYFVKVSIKDDKLSVTQGILTVFEDSLILDNVENVETITTLLGRVLDYSTIRIYAFGSWVVVPNVKNSQEIKKQLEKIIESKKTERCMQKII